MEEFLNPLEILKKIRLKESMTAADFGSGSGGWVIPLARKLEDGKVYAIDILEEPLSALKSRADLEKITNIETIQSDVENKGGSRLISSSCDLVLMTNLLFQCKDKKTVLEEAKRALREGGKILIVDWEIDAPKGPTEGRVSAEEIKEIAANIGLKLEKDFEAGVYHYGLIFEK